MTIRRFTFREKTRRKRILVMVALMFFFLACGWLPNIYEPFYIPRVQATIVNFTVQNSSDDAFQKDSDSTWDTGSIYVKCASSTVASTRFHAGFLFEGVTVPQGATINEANLSLNIYSTTYDNAKFDLYGNDVDDAATFGSGIDIISRTRTTETVLCSQNNIPIGWYVIEVTDVVEEITNRTGWSSGNNMSLLCIGQNSPYKELRCFSQDYGSDIPKLDIDYTISSSPEFEDIARSTSLLAAICDFSANCTDPDGLSHWKWRENFTGTWHEEVYSFSGSPTQGWTNITKRLPTGDVLPYELQWEIKANDTLGNWGTTGVQAFNLTALDYSDEFYVEPDIYLSGDWTTIGTDPYIDIMDYPANYIQADAAKTCRFNWTKTGVDTILSEEIRLKVNYSSTGRITTIYYKFGSEWPSATEWREASTTLGNTGGSWTVTNVSLKGENDYNWAEKNWWSFYYINQLEVNFTTDATSGTVNIDFARIYFDAYENSTRQVQWIFDNIVNRMENSSFPLTYKYYENQTTLSDVADNKLLYGVYLYGLYKNQTFMDYANLYGNWLLSQPKCRVFQDYNFTSGEWNTKISSEGSCYRLFALAELANQNNSYVNLLKNVVENFTDIFYHAQIGDASKNHIVAQADINGTVTNNIVDCPESWSVLAYTSYVLGNSTIADRAINASLSYQLTTIGAPASYQKLDGTYPGGDVKSDQHWGYTLLGLSSVYYYTSNVDVKNKLKTCAECGKYFFNSSLADYGYFVYRIDKTTGEETAQQAVHGFGYAEEGCIQAGLIWNNQTWIDWALNDFKSMVINKFILMNYLILHAVNPTGTPNNYESSDGWNSMAKRCSLVWYCLNKSDFCYQNSTFVERYSQLYASTSANHAFKLNWHNSIISHTLKLYSGNDVEASSNLLFRNIQNETEETINNLAQLYNSFGNPFSGAGAKFVKPVPSNIGGDYNSTHATLYAYWTDLDGLVCGKKYWNVTGTWQLNGTITFTGNPTEHWFNSTERYPSGLSKIFWYQIVNDTEGNWGNTTIQVLEISQNYTVDMTVTFSPDFSESQKALYSIAPQMIFDIGFDEGQDAQFHVDSEFSVNPGFQMIPHADWRVDLDFAPNLVFTLDVDLEGIQKFFVDLTLPIQVGLSQLAQSIFTVDLAFQPSLTYDILEKAVFKVPLNFIVDLGFTLDVQKIGQQAQHFFVDLALQIQVGFAEAFQSIYRIPLSLNFPFSLYMPLDPGMGPSSGGPTIFIVDFILRSFEEPLADCDIEIYELPYDLYRGTLHTDAEGCAQGSFPAGHYRYYVEVDGYVKEGTFFLDSAKQITIQFKKRDFTRIFAAGILGFIIIVMVVFAVLKHRGRYR